MKRILAKLGQSHVFAMSHFTRILCFERNAGYKQINEREKPPCDFCHLKSVAFNGVGRPKHFVVSSFQFEEENVLKGGRAYPSMSQKV